MKLDTRSIRYLSAEDWRVLTAVEMGSKNHEVVPTPLIQQISGTKVGSGVHKSISALAKVGLIAKVKNAKYDGYRLTYGGLDYLALNTHRKSDAVWSLGNQIGVGKESDIYVCADKDQRKLVLKIHRLGRISFRTVKANRDYLRNRAGGSWMYLSRLAAQKEFAFMQVLRREGFPVPDAVAQSRHTVVMDFIDSFPLRQIDTVPDPAGLYAELMELIVRFARVGLIHGDFNEFNLLIKEERIGEIVGADKDGNEPVATKENLRLTPIVIDFPQMMSTTHVNAQYYFDRDVECIRRFFERRFKYTSDEPGPFFADAIKGSDKNKRLDIEVEATGFSRKMAKDLDRYIEAVGLKSEAEQDDADAGYDMEDEDEEDGEDDEDEEEDQEVPEDQELQIAADPVDRDELRDEQVDEPKLAEELGSLGLHDKSADALDDPVPDIQPVELPQHPDAAQEKTQSKKKKAGWSI